MSFVSLTPLFPQMFVGELDRLSLAVTGEIHFAISTGGKVVFECSYVPDADGEVNLYELGKIFGCFMPELCAEFSMTVDGEPLGPETITVFHCEYGLVGRASDFLQKSFLTSMQSPRQTAAGRYETLSLYSTEDEEAFAGCYYFADGEIITRNKSLGSASGSRLLNVSPNRFADGELGMPYAYVVMCGARSARFEILPAAPEVSDAFIFRNAFNAWETFYLTGTRETSPEYTRSTANVNGFKRNYVIDEVVQQKAYTGPLADGMERVAMDLARSKAVFFLLGNGDCGDEALINDCDLKHNNDGFAASDLNLSYRQATLTYRLADDRTARIHVPRPPRIFDYTFDQTYE